MPTEHEMKEFFQSIIDQVATLSSQAARVEGLEQRINELTQRINESEQRYQELNQKYNDVMVEFHNTQDMLNHTQQSLDNERAVTQSLRDTLVGRDSKVQELEHNVEAERTAHKLTLNERDDARRRGDELETQVNSFREHVTHLENDLSGWKDRAYKAEAEVNDLKSKLAKVQSILQPLQAISGDMQATG